MSDNEMLLLAKKALTMTHHFKKGAAHHEHKAAAHLKMHEAHKAYAEHHEKMHGDHEDGVNKAHHKAAMAFHKAKAVHHEKLHKLHKAHAEHHHAMAAAHEAGDHTKVFKLAEMEEEPLTTRPITTEDAVAKAAADKAAADKAAADKAALDKAAAGGTPTSTPAEANINDTIQKALDTKLTEAVSAAFERVLNSGEFNQKVDQAIAGKLLEKLGSSTVDANIKTFPVPRAGSQQPTNGNEAVKNVDISGLDPELAELCKTEF